MQENRTIEPSEAAETGASEAAKKKNLQTKAPKKSKKASGRKRKAQVAERRCLASDWLTPDSLKIITQWKRNGLTDQEVEENIGVAHSTFCAWKKKYPDLSNALKHGRARADALVENALFLAATGSIQTIKKVVIDKATGKPALNEDGTVMTYDEQAYIKPDPKAMIFYLTNRVPDKWQMNRNLTLNAETDKEGSGGGSVEIIVRNQSLQELEQKAIEQAKAQDEEEKKRAAAGGA